jgi:predicted kinase
MSCQLISARSYGFWMHSARRPLIVFSGLPGVGKSVLARALSLSLSAVLIRVDELEAVMRRTGIEDSQPTGLAAYTVAEVIAERCLRAGCGAVVDAVNALEAPRQRWREVARRTAAVICVVEVVCSDAAEHRRRVESRNADMSGQVLPTWQDVLTRAFEPWQEERLVIDTCALEDHAAAVQLFVEQRLLRCSLGQADRPG